MRLFLGVFLVWPAAVSADDAYENVKLFHEICLSETYDFRETPLPQPRSDLLPAEFDDFPGLRPNISEGQVGLWLLYRSDDDVVFVSIGMDEEDGIASCQLVFDTPDPEALAAEFPRYLAFEPFDGGPREFSYRQRFKYERNNTKWLVSFTYSLEPGANALQAASFRDVGTLKVE